MPRNRRLDAALGASRRSIWIATGAILLLGVLLVVWLISPAERERREVMSRLNPGDHMGRVADLLGPPSARCPTSSLAHFARNFPPGWSDSAVGTTLHELERETADRWVYSLDPSEPAGCDPAEGRTEIGLDATGRILWHVAITGESVIVLPERFTPAAVNLDSQ